MRSTQLGLYEGRFVGADRDRRQRRGRPASSTTTRRSRACRRSIAIRSRFKLNFPDRRACWSEPDRQRQTAAVAPKSSKPTATATDGRWRIRSAPGHYRLRGVSAAGSASCSRRILASARSSIRRSTDPADRGARRRTLARQEDPDDRPDRDQRHRGSQSASASHSSRTART